MVKFIKYLLKLPEINAELSVRIDELEASEKYLTSQIQALETQIKICNDNINDVKHSNEQEAEARDIMNEYFFGKKGDYR